MEVLGENLISYEGVIDFLKKKKKGKNFFDTLRTRHKLIHKPIIKPPFSFSIKGTGIKVRRGRAVFYLKEIKPFLEDIIRLHDEEHQTFRQIEEKMRERKLQLDALREFDLSFDNRVKPEEFLGRFELAKMKLRDYMKWSDKSEEIRFLEYIYRERSACGKRFYELTKELREAAEKGIQAVGKGKEAERDSLGVRIDFCHQIMEGVINQLNMLENKGQIKVTADDYKEVSEFMNKR